MFFKKGTFLSAVMLALLSTPLHADTDDDEKKTPYFSGARTKERSTPDTYSADMHTLLQDSSLREQYEENGRFYYSGVTNSFGFEEVINPKEEVIFCAPSDMTFSDAVREAASQGVPASHFVTNDYDGWGVREDSTSFSLSPTHMQSGILNTMISNSKGRFCYRPDDNNVDYRYSNADSAKAVYCDSGQVRSYVDEVSGFACNLTLDVDLKVGRTRYVRQLQDTASTVAQGFLGCYANETSGVAELHLIENPDDCSSSNRTSCINSCDWAEDVVCDPRDMPSWGGGMCAGYGTVIFKGDVIEVQSSPQLSYQQGEGGSIVKYSGTATMMCVMVDDGTGNKARWSVVDSNCTRTE
tara:strand:- start:1875 stop:2936 length:1062 start_codon:yes stop_codon:yes gene_type:complete